MFDIIVGASGSRCVIDGFNRWAFNLFVSSLFQFLSAEIFYLCAFNSTEPFQLRPGCPTCHCHHRQLCQQLVGSSSAKIMSTVADLPLVNYHDIGYTSIAYKERFQTGLSGDEDDQTKI